MLSVDVTITKFRRDLIIAGLLRATLMTVALMCVIAPPVLGLRQDWMPILVAVGGIWIVLSYRSMQGTRIAADSPSLIAAGEFDQAENHINAALKRFSLFRTGKILSLYHLSVLRHAQSRWREAALLSQAVLSQKLGNMQGMARTSLLMLADSMIQLGDLRGAFAAMQRLFHHRLSLGEALTLQLLQLDYGWRIGAWDAMLQGVSGKVQMCELMPSINSARGQALLALAAYRTNRTQLAQWLRRRSELLAEPAEIAAGRPVLEEMFRQPL
jgi:hypothetical protein